jgi:hypothetical protein
MLIPSLMRNIFVYSITLLTISVCSYGQDTTQLKRTPYKLTAAVDKHSTYEEEIKGTPYVLPDKTIQLYLGETVYFEVVQENGNIKSMTAVRGIKNPTTTLTISLTQDVKRKVHVSTVLHIKNPFADTLIYKPKTFLLKQKKWIDNIAYPIPPGLSSYTIWPDIITSIVLGDWTLKSN